MEQHNSPSIQKAVEDIESAILQSQYLSAKLVNQQQLALYYGIGKYVSRNSRKGFWGKGAIETISIRLKRDFPGLRGFSVTNLRLMRQFYEGWESPNSSVATDENSAIEIHQLQLMNLSSQELTDFMSVGFTIHAYIISKIKDRKERLYYIREAAQRQLNVEALKNIVAADEYHSRGSLPNNFSVTLQDKQFARRALMNFKDEYLLDFINTEEIGIRDADDIDEKVVEKGIVNNIKKFIMTFGHDFS